jgi:hypothetical protein
MPENAENLSILSQLDESEKPGIITDEELEEIGVAYGSRKKYHEAMQTLAVYLSGATPRRPASIPGGMGKAPPRINSGTSTVHLGEIQKARRINIVGKTINAPDDAAGLFSAFRDPRIEIFNIAYASFTGEILAHTAWTSGLPGAARITDSKSRNEGFSRILDIRNKLGADKIWIAHNHPSGNPEPSPEDISVTKNYNSFFGSNFAGHIVLDHDRYSLIAPSGQHSIWGLKRPAKNFISRRREQSAVVSSPEIITSMFKKVLSNKEDVSAFAVLDGSNRVVSWIYGGYDYAQGIKDYMRISGGSKVIVLSNSGALHKKYSALAESTRGTKNDIFLDVIKVSRTTGLSEESLAEKSYPGGKWQMHESEGIKYIAYNQTMQPELGFSLSGPSAGKDYSSDAGWDDANVLIRDFRNPCFFKIDRTDPSAAAVLLSVYDSREAMQAGSPYTTFDILGDIKTAKQLVNRTIEDIMLFDNARDLFIHDITRHLGMHISSLKREIAAAEPDAQYSAPSPAGRENNSKEKNMSGKIPLRIVKPDPPAWWILAFQKEGETICIVEDGDKINKQYIDALKSKYGSSYEVYGEYTQKESAIKAVKENLIRAQNPTLLNDENLQLTDPLKQAAPPVMDGGKNINSKEKNMPDQFEWDNDNMLGIWENEFYPLLIKVGYSDSSSAAKILVFDPPEALEFNSPYSAYEVQGGIEKAKQLVEKTIAHLYENLNLAYDPLDNQKISISHDFSKYLRSFVNSEQNTAAAESQKQGPSPSPSGRNNNSKEKNMSDETIPEKARDPKEEAFLNAVHQRKVIADAIKAGTLSCLPGPDGYADTAPAVNLANGTRYHGANMLFLKEHQKQNGFPSAEYVTSQQIDRAKEDNKELFIRKGEKGVSLYVSEQNEETGKWEDKQIRLFNIAQTSKPWEMKKWAEQKQEEKAQERQDFLQTQYGDNYRPAEQKQKEPGPEIVCKSTDPEKYLGQYLAAVSMGGKFKASPEQAAEFSQKMQDAMYEKLLDKEGNFVLAKKGEHIGEPVSNPFKLEEISRNAGQHCKEVIRDIRMEARKAEQPEQKLDQQQSHSRKM